MLKKPQFLSIASEPHSGQKWSGARSVPWRQDGHLSFGSRKKPIKRMTEQTSKPSNPTCRCRSVANRSQKPNQGNKTNPRSFFIFRYLAAIGPNSFLQSWAGVGAPSRIDHRISVLNNPRRFHPQPFAQFRRRHGACHIHQPPHSTFSIFTSTSSLRSVVPR